MKKGLTEVVFILDRSGSMGGLETDTIGGFNSMLKKQKKVKGDAVITTILFDTSINVLHDREDIKTVNKMTARDYTVGGCTALLDAIGSTIRRINEAQKQMPEEERPEKTMFVITTDGYENSSKDYTYEKIRKMINKKQENKDWEFLFLGANIDAIQTAGNLGIRADRATNYHSDHVGTKLNYKTLSNAVSSFRCAAPGMCASVALDGWSDDIAKDYSARK